MRFEMRQPWSGSRASVLRISRSTVPWRRSDGFGILLARPLTRLDNDTSTIDNDASIIDNADVRRQGHPPVVRHERLPDLELLCARDSAALRGVRSEGHCLHARLRGRRHRRRGHPQASGGVRLPRRGHGDRSRSIDRAPRRRVNHAAGGSARRSIRSDTAAGSTTATRLLASRDGSSPRGTCAMRWTPCSPANPFPTLKRPRSDAPSFRQTSRGNNHESESGIRCGGARRRAVRIL